MQAPRAQAPLRASDTARFAQKLAVAALSGGFMLAASHTLGHTLGAHVATAGERVGTGRVGTGVLALGAGAVALAAAAWARK